MKTTLLSLDYYSLVQLWYTFDNKEDKRALRVSRRVLKVHKARGYKLRQVSGVRI